MTCYFLCKSRLRQYNLVLHISNMYIYMSLQRSASHCGATEGDEFIDTVINMSAGGSNGGGNDDPVE
jgi:hypothetical protein